MPHKQRDKEYNEDPQWRPVMESHDSDIQRTLAHVAAYDAETTRMVRLVPTEGVMSPLQRLMFLSVQHERYLHAPDENNAKAIRYPDIAHLQAIHLICRRLCQKVFDASYANVDFLSGLHCMSICISALTERGDQVLSIDSSHGGHESTSWIVTDLGRHHTALPFDLDEHVVDAKRLDTTLRPRLVYVDHSNILRPHDIRSIRRAYPEARLVCDASQVMALVAGRVFPNPLDAGADVMVGSTHKSLNGPQKAILVTRSQDVVDRVTAHTVHCISNNHPASVAALAVCLSESDAFGAGYATALVGNAQALEASLCSLDLPVYMSTTPQGLCATETQHVWIDCSKAGWSAEDAVRRLYSAGIVANTLFLPRGGVDGLGAKGLRLGTTEVTRLGMGHREMDCIAAGIADTLRSSIPLDAIRDRMRELRSLFCVPKYCYPGPADLPAVGEILQNAGLPPGFNR